jgi:hypothetical protein
MRLISTSIISTDALGQLVGRKQAMVFDDVALAMHPLWLNGIQPGTLLGQEEGQDANALARLLDLPIVFSDPGAHQLAVVPDRVVPDQEPVAFALLCETHAAPVKKLDRDGCIGYLGHPSQQTRG